MPSDTSSAPRCRWVAGSEPGDVDRPVAADLAGEQVDAEQDVPHPRARRRGPLSGWGRGRGRGRRRGGSGLAVSAAVETLGGRHGETRLARGGVVRGGAGDADGRRDVAAGQRGGRDGIGHVGAPHRGAGGRVGGPSPASRPRWPPRPGRGRWAGYAYTGPSSVTRQATAGDTGSGPSEDRAGASGVTVVGGPLRAEGERGGGRPGGDRRGGRGGRGAGWVRVRREREPERRARTNTARRRAPRRLLRGRDRCTPLFGLPGGRVARRRRNGHLGR